MSDALAQTQDEFTPTQAARAMGISRPQVGKLMDEGKLQSRMVGGDHRITASSIDAFKKWERERMSAGMPQLSQLQNELGLVD